MFWEQNLTFVSEKPTPKDRLNRSSKRYVFYVFNFAYEPPTNTLESTTHLPLRLISDYLAGKKSKNKNFDTTPEPFN